MAAKDKLSKAGDAAHSAQQSQYMQRLIEDEELRSNLLSAYEAARSAYGRMSNGKPADRGRCSRTASSSRRLTNAANALRHGDQLATRGARRARAAQTRYRALARCCSQSAAIAALALSEGLRSKLLDLLFGAEEEFDYSSTTTPETPAPAGVAGS